MNTLAQLRQRQQELKAKGDDVLTKLEAAEETDQDTTALDDEWNNIEKDLKQVAINISTEESRSERRRSLNSIQSVPALDNAVNDLNPETTGGFNDVAEFALAVRDACNPGGPVVDQRLSNIMAAPANQHEGGGSAGEGYMLPTQMRDEIFEVVTATDNLFDMTDVEPTVARQVLLNRDESTPWGATGIQARWRAESSQMTADKLVTEGENVSVHELYAFVLATEELLEDAARLANRITRGAGRAISWKRDDAVVYGSGVGQPLGWFNSAALVSIAKEGGQSADTLTVLNLAKMFARLLVLPGDRPMWLANSDILPQLITLTIGNQPAWIPASAGMTNAPSGFLLGIPLKFTEHGKTLGDKGDIQLVSLKGYYSLKRTSGPAFAESMHLFFDYNMKAFRWTFRIGGQPYLSAPVAPANGSNTKSHFITLDERA